MSVAPVLFVADLHGHDDLFDEAVDRGRELAGRADITVVCLGDFVDNGPAIPELLDRLIAFKNEHPGRFAPILGNHDAACLLALGDMRRSRGCEAWWDRWRGYANGIDLWTPTQYGASHCGAFREAFPHAHREFLLRLPPFRKIGNYLAVHAGLQRGSIERQLRVLKRPRLGGIERIPEPIRDRKLGAVFDPAWVAIVVSGHVKHPGGQDFVAPNRISLHSGTCFGGLLHAVLLPAEARVGEVPVGEFFTVGEATSPPALPSMRLSERRSGAEGSRRGHAGRGFA